MSPSSPLSCVPLLLRSSYCNIAWSQRNWLCPVRSRFWTPSLEEKNWSTDGTTCTWRGRKVGGEKEGSRGRLIPLVFLLQRKVWWGEVKGRRGWRKCPSRGATPRSPSPVTPAQWASETPPPADDTPCMLRHIAFLLPTPSLTDGRMDTYWQSNGSPKSHWIR